MRIMLELSEPEWRRLMEQATRDRRTTRDEAAWLLLWALAQREPADAVLA